MVTPYYFLLIPPDKGSSHARRKPWPYRTVPPAEPPPPVMEQTPQHLSPGLLIVIAIIALCGET